MSKEQTIYRTCPLCEATCGIAVGIADGQVTSIRGDDQDPFSRGYICPKAHGLKALQEDPDRLRAPLRRTSSGWQEVSWDEALGETVTRLQEIRSAHGKDAVGIYVGNPAVHNLHSMVYLPALITALGTRQRYSASSVDQLPKMVSCGLMFGGGLTIPIPDIDRSSFLMILGSNPLVSNGSLMTAPDIRKRLDGIMARGGKVVVIDPRRTETARRASEHHFIRPGTDALFLLAMVHVMFDEERIDLGAVGEHIADRDQSLERVRQLVSDFRPDRVAGACGIDGATIARLARELCDAESAACHGRIGTTCQAFGTVASWAVDLVNILSGNLDRPGGVMFPRAAAMRGAARGEPSRRGVDLGRWRSRIRDLPEMFGELPTVTLADEILSDGDGQIHAMITVAGNPVRSAPGSDRLEKAFAALDFYVAVDIYRNETTRHADIILPPPSPLERDSYDLAFYRLAIRNIAKYSPPALAKPEGQPDEWEILLSLAKGLMGQAKVPVAAADEFVFRQLLAGEIREDCLWDGLTQDEAAAALGARQGPARALDLLLRTGPYGDGFGRKPDGLSLQTLEDAPHGLDLGALEPQLPEVLRTRDGRIDLAPALITDDLDRLRAEMDTTPAEPAGLAGAADSGDHTFALIGRRNLRCNNSWMHNLHPLVKGRDRCTLLIHESDAARLELENGQVIELTSRAGSVRAPVEISSDMMPGVVSLPHGWGHDTQDAAMEVAAAHPGVNVNVLSDDQALDVPSGNAALNGIAVVLRTL